MARLFFTIALQVALDIAIGNLANYADMLDRRVQAECGVRLSGIEVVI